jgi:Uma2 family endonuclease
MAMAARAFVTLDEYLAGEGTAVGRSEYLNGEIFAMSGGTPRHSRIASNLGAVLNHALLNGPSIVYTSDLRIKIPATGLYTYPDLSVVCGPEEYAEEGGSPSLVNPTVLVEVLSPTTEAYDRGEKARHYRALPSLEEYVLIAQDRPRIEQFRRHGAVWVSRVYEGWDAILVTTPEEIAVPLSRIYHRAIGAGPPGSGS